ncbi:MAG: hydroxymethylglutaryl-CoA lyase [Phycisphaerae bacterium]
MKPMVRITDVSPRDGLQNEQSLVPTEKKVELVRRLIAANCDEIEITSFVSPKWIPQLADAAEVLAAVAVEKPAGMCFSVLVPNERGMQGAIETNQRLAARVIDKISVFTAASETFARKNTNATIAETLQRFEPVIAGARRERLLTRGYVSCAVQCPFEGPIAPSAVADVCARLLELGVDELDVADTIGVGTPETVGVMLEAVIERIGGANLPRLTLHMHDTFGHAGACVQRALDLGVRSFDGSAGGLGGCPYAGTPERRAPGNIATELLIAAIESHGFATRVDRAALAEAGAFARRLILGQGNKETMEPGNKGRE